MTRGRPFQPGNQFGRGRPQGSRNKRSRIAQELLDTYAESIIRKAMVLGLQGDSLLLGTLLSYILPRRKDWPIRTGALRITTMEDLDLTSEAVLKKTSTGQLTLSEAQALSELIENRRRVLETRDLDQRIRALEQSQTETQS